MRPPLYWDGYVKSVTSVMIGATLLSCVSTTGTKTNLTAAELEKLRSTGIVVESKHPLSVRVARDNLTNTGAVLFGLIGAAVEAGYKSSKDTGHEENISRVLSDFDPAKESAGAFREKFVAVKAFPVVEIVHTEDARILRAQGFDAVFKETIEEWGLRLCAGDDNVRVGFDVHMQLTALQKESIVWERDELFMDGPCRPLSDFQTNKDLLRAGLKAATETLAGKTANEIAFP
jgi:hypothetical protein